MWWMAYAYPVQAITTNPRVIVEAATWEEAKEKMEKLLKDPRYCYGIYRKGFTGFDIIYGPYDSQQEADVWPL